MKKKSITISVITLFPEFIEQYAGFGIISRAIKNKLVQFRAVQLRSFGLDRRGTVDDRPYGGGELPSLVISEAVLRLVPGVLGKDDSADAESFTENMLEYPQYTKPEVLEVKTGAKVQKLRVPKVLLSGHHVNVAAWRKEEALKRTKKRRPDLLDK